LVALATARVERLAHTMLRGQFVRVRRWVETGDVLQNTTVRLWKALGDNPPETPLHFHRLIARLIRNELIDLARHFYGPQGPATHHDTGMALGAGPESDHRPNVDPTAPSVGPSDQIDGVELHLQVQSLPDDEAAVTDLLFYQGLTQEEAAEVLEVDVRTIQRRWQRARRRLGAMLTDPL